MFVGGGEPTNWLNVVDLFKAIADSGRSAYVITNGSRPDVLELLFAAGMKKAVVSFFSSQGKVHNLVTRSEHFSALEKSLAVCSGEGRSLHVNYVVTRFNQGGILDDVRYLTERYRPVSVTFQPIILFGRAALAQKLTVPDIEVAAMSVNAAIRHLRDAGVVELKVAFFPHCLLEDPDLAEDSSASTDEERRRLVEEIAKTSPGCAGCSRAGTCHGLPQGYSHVGVRPFA